jgi:Holliday junction resolvase
MLLTFFEIKKKKKGSIIVKPKSSMKVNPLIIKFSGVIYIAAKEKEVIPLFQTCKLIPINKGKSKLLEAKLHSFPFEFVVPDNLPSAMDVK